MAFDAAARYKQLATNSGVGGFNSAPGVVQAAVGAPVTQPKPQVAAVKPIVKPTTVPPTTAVAEPKPLADWQQKLQGYVSDSNAGYAELDRATKQMGYYNAIGDKVAAANANKWIGQVNQVLGTQKLDGSAQANDQFAQDLAALKAMGQKQPGEFKAPEAFNYNAETDPAYQAALRRAEANAKSASGNAMEQLNSRGILNSTVTSDRLGQIQQDEIGRVSDTILPQLMDQAYGRYSDDYNRSYQQYTDQYNMGQQGFQNTASVLDRAMGLNQQNINNDAQKRAANLDAALQVGNATGKLVSPQDDWNGLFRQAGNSSTPLNAAGQAQQFGQGVTMAQLTGTLPNGKKTTAEEQRQLENLWQVAAQTGTIPDGLAAVYGLPKGTKTQDAYQFAVSANQNQQQIGISQQNANTSATSAANSNSNQQANLALDKDKFAYQQTNDAAQLEADKAKSAATPTAQKEELETLYRGDYSEILKDPAKGYKEMKDNADYYIKKYGVTKYNALLKAAGG